MTIHPRRLSTAVHTAIRYEEYEKYAGNHALYVRDEASLRDNALDYEMYICMQPCGVKAWHRNSNRNRSDSSLP